MNVHKSSYSPNSFFCATYSLFDAISFSVICEEVNQNPRSY